MNPKSAINNTCTHLHSPALTCTCRRCKCAAGASVPQQVSAIINQKSAINNQQSSIPPLFRDSIPLFQIFLVGFFIYNTIYNRRSNCSFLCLKQKQIPPDCLPAARFVVFSLPQTQRMLGFAKTAQPNLRLIHRR
jgi:hypothetical protein